MQNRVFLIKGTASSWFLEAFFVVSPHETVPGNLVLEAEKIVKNYLYSYGLTDSKEKPEQANEQQIIHFDDNPPGKPEKHMQQTPYFLYFLISVCLFLLGYVLRGVI